MFHRWHHTLEAEGLNKNFAPTFPVLDLIFGTFYMPTGKLPEHFGNGEHDFPEGFLGQLVYPFTQKQAQEESQQRKAASRRRPTHEVSGLNVPLTTCAALSLFAGDQLPGGDGEVVAFTGGSFNRIGEVWMIAEDAREIGSAEHE